MDTAINYPVPDRVKPSFVILTSGHSDAQPRASECPDIKNYKWRLNPVWYTDALGYSCSTAAVPIWQQLPENSWNSSFEMFSRWPLMTLTALW